MNPTWPPAPKTRILIFAPHPDDESIAVGGLIQQASEAGADCRIIFITDGDDNPWPQRAIERRWHITGADKQRWGSRRRSEAVAALEVLGITANSAVFWGFPDQGLTGILMSNADLLLKKLVLEIQDWKPTLLLSASLHDRHPDHSALAVLCRIALAQLGPDHSLPLLMEYLVHSRGLTRFIPSLVINLSTEHQARKRAAIIRHESQTILRPSLPDSARSREEFIAPDEIRNSIYHPVRKAVLNDGEVLLDLHLSSHLDAFGRPALYLVSFSQGRLCKALFLHLPIRGNATLDIHDVGNAGVIGKAEFSGNRRCGRLRIPLTMLLPADFIFVKIERRFGFFDEAGWAKLLLGLSICGK